MITADKPSDGRSGKTPGLVSATHYANEFVISSPGDYSRGLLTLTIKRTDSGELRYASAEASDQLSQAPRDIKIDRLNIQRAQSAVVVTDDQGNEYAIVSDDNYNFLDPYWQAQFEAPMSSWTPAGYIYAGGSIAAKKVAVGGKLGVVKDPFAKKGAPKFLGATLPLDGYGITGLSVSEDGKVIIGQLKGGYGTIHQFIQQPSKNAAWNVKTLLDAANNMKEENRMSDHLVVAGSEIPLVGSWTLGTFFDGEPFPITLNGRLGDVMEIDVIDLIARQELRFPYPDGSGNELNAIQRGNLADRVRELKARMSEFTFDTTAAADFVTNVSANGLRLLTRGPVTGGTPLNTLAINGSNQTFAATGQCYFAPNLTSEDLATLRMGGQVNTEKSTTVNITYKDGARTYTLHVTLKANDTPAAPGRTFFGDRPLDNPGYSALSLSQGVGLAGSNNLLDNFKVEQRLKYLGFDDYANKDTTNIPGFTVDGVFGAAEKSALKLFEKVVRTGEIPKINGAAITGQANNVEVTKSTRQATAKVRVSLTCNGINLNGSNFSAPVVTVVSVNLKPSNGITSLTGDALTAAMNDPTTGPALTAAIEAAKNEALAWATALATDEAQVQAQADFDRKMELTKHFTSDEYGADGALRANSVDVEDKTTLNWLNAYNAPHWMTYSFGAEDPTHSGLTGWQAASTVKAGGTSWIYDLMRASQITAKDMNTITGTTRELLTFAGSGDLGAELNLGINPHYISPANQNRINGDDVINGIFPDAAPAGITHAAGYQGGQWLYQNGLDMAASLLNPNIHNDYNSVTKTFGAAPNNSNTQSNQQNQVLLDLIAVISATQTELAEEGVAGNGSWEEQAANIQSGQGAQQQQILQAILGDGRDRLNLDDVKLGGTAKTLGVALTAENLKLFMGSDKPLAYYQQWLTPLKKAMVEFDITTPKRIAAFFAQIKQESGGLMALKENTSSYRLHVLLSTFRGLFTQNYPTGHAYYAADNEANPNHDGVSLVQKRHDRFDNLMSWINSGALGEDTKTLVAGITFDETRPNTTTTTTNAAGVTTTTPVFHNIVRNGVEAEDFQIPLDTLAKQEAFADRYLSDDVGNGETGDGLYTDKQGHNWTGRGPLQLTHASSLGGFADWVAVKHPELIEAETYSNGTLKTKAVTLREHMDLIVADTANGRALGALSAAWFWDTTASTLATAHNVINRHADALAFGANDTTNFLAITHDINKADEAAPARFTNYNNIRRFVIGEEDPLKVGNPYENVVNALDHMGVIANNAYGYQSKIGLSLNRIAPIKISGSDFLIADTTNISTAINAQINWARLIAATQNSMGLSPEETEMWIDQPLDINSPPAIYLAANTKTTKALTKEPNSAGAIHKLGVCETLNDGTQEISPVDYAQMYYQTFVKGVDSSPLTEDMDFREKIKVTIIKQPQHGEVVRKYPNAIDKSMLKFQYTFNSTDDFVGTDQFVIDVSAGKFHVQIHYTMEVLNPGESPVGLGFCPDEIWKISNVPTPNDIQTTITFANSIDAAIAKAFTGFTDLPGTSLGQATGTGPAAKITLDTNAAGHGWYIDSTPLSNEEFLPTADANIWQAKPGSGAEGKMDMLSVLLHEYGHSLGLEHSTAASDAMAATLKPGERRLFTADELAQVERFNMTFAALDASPQTPSQPGSPQVPNTSLLLGLSLIRRRSAMDTGADNLTAANASLTNGTFGDSTLADATGWTRSGTVTFSANGAQLLENPNQQTALRQVFTLGDHDRYLRFIVQNDLHSNTNNGPNDAFEAALLDANTGTALRNIAGLSHSDAFLNLQGDTNHTSQTANTLHMAENLDGSRTYTLDLAGLTSGQAVELSFDLLGFGEADSAVLVSQVQLLSDLQARNDSASTLEDTAVNIAVRANDEILAGDAVQTLLLAGPQHGTAQLNPDGSFTYTPEANWFGMGC